MSSSTMPDPTTVTETRSVSKSSGPRKTTHQDGNDYDIYKAHGRKTVKGIDMEGRVKSRLSLT